MIEYVRSIAKGRLKTEILEMLNRKFNTNFDVGNINTIMSCYRITSGLNCRFEKGQKPWNKGVPMRQETLEKLKPTLFHDGHMPWTHRDVGSTSVDKDGHLIIKISDTQCKKVDWIPVKNLVWEMHNGKIPDGHIITVLDGNNMNLNISNLACISRAENVALNKKKWRFDNGELTKTSLNILRLEKKVREKCNDN